MSFSNPRGGGPKRYFPQSHTSPSTASLISQSQRDSSSSNNSSLPDTRFSPARQARGSITPSVSDQYSLAADPVSWGMNVSSNYPEPDDALHNPDPMGRDINRRGSIFTLRGLQNVGCLLFLVLCIVALFAGYPILSYFLRHPLSTLGGFNLGGINATGQIPSMAGQWGVIDADTPRENQFITSYETGEKMELVFSDEFNKDGRSFYPGDDPYWEAVDLHYWATGNMEWYDPSAVTTKDGALEITLSKERNHGMRYMGAMIATWNKFCFTGGMVLASVMLPGSNDVGGLWPAVWAMGNLGRAGFGATLDGMWPYSYDACDVGTLKNQTKDGLPLSSATEGDQYHDGALSYQPGQRLSRCTCKGESHPGPIHKDGSYVGRAAPEIDVLEAFVHGGEAGVSQSAQWAPYNAGYNWFNATGEKLSPGTIHNSYQGGVYQQTTSGVSPTRMDCYDFEEKCFAIYGFEYKPGYDDGYIAWINDNKWAWTVTSAGLAADPIAEISARPVPFEPMYLIMNLGLSQAFGAFDEDLLTLPTKMKVDWIRVYQPVGKRNIGCDPVDFPTSAYIEKYKAAYTNPNYTTWKDDFKQPVPKNRLVDNCT